MVAFYTLLRKEVKRFLKVMMQTIVTPFMSSFLYLLVFGVSLGSKVDNLHQVPYLAFLIPGLMMMSLMNNAFQNSSSSIAVSKFSGDLEDLRVAPLTPHHLLLSMGLGAVVRGAVVAIITYIVGIIFYYLQFQEILTIKHPLILIYFILAGGFENLILQINQNEPEKAFAEKYVAQYDTFLKDVKTIEYFNYDIGFYSSGNWLRKELGDAELDTNDAYNEQLILTELIKLCNKNNYKLRIYCHPIEKRKPELTTKYYQKFNSSNFSIAPFDKPSIEEFDQVNIAISLISTLMFERYYLGLKTIIAPINYINFPISNSNFNNVCIKEVDQLEKIINKNNKQLLEQYLMIIIH